jgi:hypothetical protein
LPFTGHGVTPQKIHLFNKLFYLNYLGKKAETDGSIGYYTHRTAKAVAAVARLLGSGQYNSGPISTPNIMFSVNLMTASKLYVHNKSATLFNNKNRGRPLPQHTTTSATNFLKHIRFKLGQYTVHN